MRELQRRCQALQLPSLGEGPRASLVSYLEKNEAQLRLVARVFFLGGLFGAILLLQAAVDAETAPWVLAMLAGLALVCCGTLPAAIADTNAEKTLLRLLPVPGSHWCLAPSGSIHLRVSTGSMSNLRAKWPMW